MTALIDADSIMYILAYNHREHTDVKVVTDACDDFAHTILTMVRADDYIGTFSAESNFRYKVYRYAKYKGERPEKPEWFKFWEPIIKQHFIDKWKFVVPEDLEADDIVCALAENNEGNCIICSPDKDMKQIIGLHYDYKKTDAVPMIVDSVQANYFFWLQMLTGDGTDNIKGVPGLGEVKAKKILDAVDDPVLYLSTVVGEYRRYFGDHYGPIIAAETRLTIQLMSSKHPLWKEYSEQIKSISLAKQPVPSRSGKSGFELIQE